jgi:hypothetical protein
MVAGGVVVVVVVCVGAVCVCVGALFDPPLPPVGTLLLFGAVGVTGAGGVEMAGGVCAVGYGAGAGVVTTGVVGVVAVVALLPVLPGVGAGGLMSANRSSAASTYVGSTQRSEKASATKKRRFTRILYVRRLKNLVVFVFRAESDKYWLTMGILQRAYNSNRPQ